MKHSSVEVTELQWSGSSFSLRVRIMPIMGDELGFHTIVGQLYSVDVGRRSYHPGVSACFTKVDDLNVYLRGMAAVASLSDETNFPHCLEALKLRVNAVLEEE